MGKDCHAIFTAGNHCWSRLNNVLRGSACQGEKAGCLCNFSSPRAKELEVHPRLQAIKLGFICWVWGRQPALPGGCFYHKFSSTPGLCSAFPLVFRTQLHILSGPSKTLKRIKPFNASWLALVIETLLLPFWDQSSLFWWCDLNFLLEEQRLPHAWSIGSCRSPLLFPKGLMTQSWPPRICHPPGPWDQLQNGDVTWVS